MKIPRIVLLLIGALLASSALAQDQLNVLGWCDHTDPRLLNPFEEQHRVRVNVREYDGTGMALSLLQQSRAGDWDVFVVDSVDVPRVVNAGYLAPLEDADFPWDDIFEQLREPDLHYQDGVLYALPEKLGYNTVAFNGDAVDLDDMRTIQSLFDPKYKGRIAVYDYYIPIMGMMAISLGMTPSDISEETLPQIRDQLFKLKENVALIGDVVAVQTALVTGEVDIIAGGAEFAVAGLQDTHPHLDWVLPEEGGMRSLQAIGVFATSNRKELATEFVKYIVSPEGQERLATSSCYWQMPANREAPLDESAKEVLRWDEQEGYLENSYSYFIPDEELDALMLDVWTEFLQH